MLEILLQLESLDDRYRYAGPFLSRPQRFVKGLPVPPQCHCQE